LFPNIYLYVRNEREKKCAREEEEKKEEIDLGQ
jgi:hypothetical protein